MKQILLFILMVGFFTGAYAQDQQPDDAKGQQKIEALYVAYITKTLNLNEEEAQKFWPVHAQFDAELKSVKLELPELDRQQQQLNIKKKYQDRFSKILGNDRTNDFFRKDGEFRKKLVEQLRNKRQQNNPNQRPFKRRNF